MCVEFTFSRSLRNISSRHHFTVENDDDVSSDVHWRVIWLTVILLNNFLSFFEQIEIDMRQRSEKHNDRLSSIILLIEGFRHIHIDRSIYVCAWERIMITTTTLRALLNLRNEHAKVTCSTVYLNVFIHWLASFSWRTTSSLVVSFSTH